MKADKTRRLTMGLLLAAVAAGCCTGNCPKDSGTTFAKDALQEEKGSDKIATVNYHRYAKQSSAELIAEGAIS